MSQSQNEYEITDTTLDYSKNVPGLIECLRLKRSRNDGIRLRVVHNTMKCRGDVGDSLKL